MRQFHALLPVAIRRVVLSVLGPNSVAFCVGDAVLSPRVHVPLEYALALKGVPMCMHYRSMTQVPQSKRRRQPNLTCLPSRTGVVAAERGSIDDKDRFDLDPGYDAPSTPKAKIEYDSSEGAFNRRVRLHLTLRQSPTSMMQLLCALVGNQRGRLVLGGIVGCFVPILLV